MYRKRGSKNRDYLAMTETYQKFQRVEYMIWLSKVFGSVISLGSGQLAKALKSGFLLGGKTLPAHLPASLQFIILT